MHVEYPKFKYHASLEPVIVKNKQEEDQLGKDWKGSPKDFGIETHPAAVAEKIPYQLPDLPKGKAKK